MSRPEQRRLVRGGAVGVVATGFAVRRAPLEAGLARLRSMGLEVVAGEHLLDRHGYLAGDDAARFADLTRMLDDPRLDAIWFARGGYGTARLLDDFPWARLRRDPKLLIGYSDLTALFNGVVTRCGTLCLHGPVVTELGDPTRFHARSLNRMLSGEPHTTRLSRRQVMVHGSARGKLVGGNLCVFSHLLGTRFAPDLDGTILFLEEVGEEAYRIDRMLNHLRQAGVFRRVAGVILGGFAVPETRRRFPGDRDRDEIFEEVFGSLDVPVVRDVVSGHVPRKLTLPLGGRVTLSTSPGRLVLEPRVL